MKNPRFEAISWPALKWLERVNDLSNPSTQGTESVDMLRGRQQRPHAD